MSDITISGPIERPRIWTEDWSSVVIGLIIFALALVGVAGLDLLGWAATTSVWVDPTRALGTVAKEYEGIGGLLALAATFVALLSLLSAAVWASGGNAKRFALAFAAVFAIAYASWFIGSYAHLAAVSPAELSKFGISWSLKLTNEGGFIIALLAGIAIANFLPQFAEWLKDAVRPELYIKIAIVILGGFIAATAASKLTLASSVLLRGLAAIVEAYLIYWAVVYFIAGRLRGCRSIGPAIICPDIPLP